MTTEEIIARYRAGQSAAAIARVAGMTRSTVYSRLYRAGVRVGPRGRNYGQPSSGWERRAGMTPAAQAVLAALANGPATVGQLAERVGYAESTLSRTLNSLRRMGTVRSRGYRWEVQEPQG